MSDEKEFTAQEFVEALNKLCHEMKYTIVASPEFRFRDDGTYSIIVVQKIQKIEEGKNDKL